MADYIDKVKKIIEDISSRKGRDICYYVETFGCQMNARDSEKLRGMLLAMGYRPCDSEDKADHVIYNTCTVREHANQRIYGRLGYLNSLKKINEDMTISLCGCMIQEKGQAEYIRKKYPFVDIMFGTYSLNELPELLYKNLSEKESVVSIRERFETLPEDLPTYRKYPFKSGVNISYGCNNFCTYCIVPYVRGREISRAHEDILSEIKKLAKEGVVEIMLLGQNVNSYGNDRPSELSFPMLLKKIEEIDGIKRIRFMTSHPKDLSDELIDVMANSSKICDHLHLPVQSGSTAVLKAMGRKYTRDDYLSLVDRIRNKMPDISLTTDIIVGFPGETDKDLDDTIDLVEQVGYDSAFTFIYSKRSGTPAAEYTDQVPADTVKERFDRLLQCVRSVAEKKCARFEGDTRSVLVEEKNRNEGLVTGRLTNNLLVHFEGGDDLIGRIVDVKLEKCEGFYYTGRMC